MTALISDLKLPIAEHSIAGYVGCRRGCQPEDVYDEGELKSHNPNLRFLQEVDKRTAIAPSRCWWRRCGAGSSELARGPAYQQQSGVPFGQLPRGGASSARRWHRAQAAPEAAGPQDKVRFSVSVP